MAKRSVKFDLTRPDRYWYKNPEKFWEEFRTSDEIKVPDDFNDWIVGQERARREASLQLEEWVRKLKDINEMREKGIKVTEVLRERPGPYLLLAGEPGTGKSLIIKSLAAQLERLYKKHDIKLQDTLLVKNKHNRYQPFTRVVPAGMGRRILDVAVREQMNRGRRRGRVVYGLILSMVLFGVVLIASGLFQLALVMGRVGLAQGWFGGAPPILQAWLGIGAIFTIFPLFFLFGGRAFGLNIGGATSKELLDTPNLLVDNGEGRRLYVNATVSNSGRLFGDIEWCNTGETLVADSAGRLHRIASEAYAEVLGNAANPILIRHSFVKDVLVVRTRSGRVLRGNPSHPVMTREGWRHLRDLTPGTAVRVATELPMPKEDVDLNWAESFSTYHGRNMSKLEVRRPRKADARLAALAGWLVAEGWVTRRNGQPIALHAEVPPSEEALADMTSDMVEGVFGVKPNRQTVSHLGGFAPSSAMIRSSICSVDIASWLGEDVAAKRVPDWVLASGEAVSSAFLRWLFEGDGCAANDSLGRVGVLLTQRNVQLLRDAQVLLLRYGIQSAIYRRKGREEHTLWIRRARDIRIFHDRIGFASAGKAGKLEAVVRALPRRTVAPSPWDEVVEVRREAPERVYGFMLGGDQSYWSNGILSHNSPYGEQPGLAAPTHKRVVAGEVHQAHMKILYIDEFRNLEEKAAVELLSVMEDGAMSIKGHQGFGGTHTASQNVATDPVDAMFFLIAGANLDVIQDPSSILNRVPALKDRFNYGNIVLMDTEMDATPENEIKVAQAVADELYRFAFPPMEKQGVREVIDYMRRKASSNRRMRIMFRSVIKILKKSAQLCWAEGDTMVRAKHVRTAIEDFAKPIEQQVLEQQVESQRPYRLIATQGAKVGTVNGLVVYRDSVSRESAGDVATVAVWMRRVGDPAKADFVVTGINEENNTWIADSKRSVRTAILRMYGLDLQKETYTHVTFLQSRGVDGPSAGITMTLAIMSHLGDPRLPPEKRVPIPLRQDVAVTGAIEIIGGGEAENPGDVVVSSVGGIADKVRGAALWGIKYVLIPMENWEHSLDSSDRRNLGVTIVGCRTVQDYLTWTRADGKRREEDGLDAP